MSVTSTLITYEQSFSLPENQFEEVIRGTSRTMPPASLAHDRLLRKLEKILDAQLGASYDILGPGVGLGISKEPFTYRVPDKMVFAAGVHKRADNPVYLWEAPQLVVECLSPANRKGPVEELVRDYLSIGVPEIWLLRPEKSGCEVHTGDHVTTVTGGVINFGSAAQVPVAMLWKAFDG